MDSRFWTLLAVGLLVYAVFFVRWPVSDALDDAKKKKKKKRRHGKKQPGQDDQAETADMSSGVAAIESASQSAAVSRNASTANKQAPVSVSTVSQDSSEESDSAPSSKSIQPTPPTPPKQPQQQQQSRKQKKTINKSDGKKQATRQQFDADFPALAPSSGTRYKEGNDMLPEEKPAAYARVMRITAPEKEKPERIVGSRKQRAMAGPDGWYTVKTVAESSIPRTTRPPVKEEPVDEDGLTKKQRANKRRTERTKMEKEVLQAEQERRLLEHRLSQMKGLYK